MVKSVQSQLSTRQDVLQFFLYHTIVVDNGGHSTFVVAMLIQREIARTVARRLRLCLLPAHNLVQKPARRVGGEELRLNGVRVERRVSLA